MYFSWGCGHDGRLGTGKEDNINQPTMTDIISKTIYRKVLANSSSSSQTMMNNNNLNNNHDNTEVQNNNKLNKKPSRKNAFGIVVNEEGIDDNNNTQQKQEKEAKKTNEEQKTEKSSGTSSKVDTATRLPYFSLRPNRVFCGGYHTFVEVVLDEKNDEQNEKNAHKNNNNSTPNALLIAFGANECGQLGVGDSSQRTGGQCVEPFFNPFGNVHFVSREKQEEQSAAIYKCSGRRGHNIEDEIDNNNHEDSSSKSAKNNTSNNDPETDRILKNLPSRTRKRNTRGEAFDITQEPYLWYRSEDLIDIQCGRFHSIALMKNRKNKKQANSNGNKRKADEKEKEEETSIKMYVCGKNESGQLGFGSGDRDNKSTFLESSFDSSSFSSMSFSNHNNQQYEEENTNSYYSSSTSIKKEILDVSCGANHSLLLLGPKKCADFVFFSDDDDYSSSCSSLRSEERSSRIQSWIEKEIEKIMFNNNNFKNNNSENDDDEGNDQGKQEELIRSLASQFSIYSCGKGDFGELGIDGDENDSRADVERRVKSALERQQHRQSMMATGSNNSNNNQRSSKQQQLPPSSSLATAGSSSWALLQEQQQQPQPQSSLNNNTEEDGQQQEQQFVHQEDEDETITSILDPSKRQQQQHQRKIIKAAAGTTTSSSLVGSSVVVAVKSDDASTTSTNNDRKKIYRVSMIRDVWTRIDFDLDRIQFSSSGEEETKKGNNNNNNNNNSSKHRIVFPIRIHASVSRSSVQALLIIIPSSSSSSSSLSTLTWFTFGCFYHNKRETIESSIPTEVSLPPTLDLQNNKVEIKLVTSIEEAEVLWLSSSNKTWSTETTTDLIFVRGGPRSYIIPSFGSDCSGEDTNEMIEEYGGESVEWSRLQIYNKKPKCLLLENGFDDNDDDAATTDSSKDPSVKAIFALGKGIIVQMKFEMDDHESEQQEEIIIIDQQQEMALRPTSASSSKSDQASKNNITMTNKSEKRQRCFVYFLSFGENYYGQLGVADDNDLGNGKCDLLSSKYLTSDKDNDDEQIVIEENRLRGFSTGVSHCGLVVK